MTDKTFKLITAIVGGLETIAVGLVTYFNPAYATAINASIIVVGTAIVEVCKQFVKTPEIVTLESPAPEKGRYNGLVFQDEIKKFITEKGGKLYLKVVKK